jgi:hypothetical protein
MAGTESAVPVFDDTGCDRRGWRLGMGWTPVWRECRRAFDGLVYKKVTSPKVAAEKRLIFIFLCDTLFTTRQEDRLKP